MKANRLVLCIAVLAIAAVAGCKRNSDGGGNSNSSGSSGASSGGSTRSTTDELSYPAAAPPKPHLGKAYYMAAEHYYYIYHKPDSVIWGDTGAEYGDHSTDSWSVTMVNGYGPTWPDFKSAVRFGESCANLAYGGTTESYSTYTTAKVDINACRTDIKGRTATTTYTDATKNLSGLSLSPGVYHFNGNADLAGGTLTLAGTGSSSDLWIFQVEGNLWARDNSRVKLTGGATASQVWWWVGVEVPVGTYRSTGPDLGPYGYTYDNMPGTWIGDDVNYPPFHDPVKRGTAANFAGTIITEGDTLIGVGSTLTGRALWATPVAHPPTYTYASIGWYLYSVRCHGSISINETAPLSMGLVSDPFSIASFAALAHDNITNSGETSIKGNVGVSSGTGTIDPGSPPWDIDSTSTVWSAGDTHPATAILAAATAATDAATRDADYNQASRDFSLLGKTLPPGVYKIDPSTAFSGTPSSDGPVTLDGRNNPDSVWIFQVAGTMDLVFPSGPVQFKYARKADPNNVVWIADKVHVGPSTNFRGTIMASAFDPFAIVLDSDSTVQGRVVAVNGSISMSAVTLFSDSGGGLLDPAFDTDGIANSNESLLNDEARSVVADASGNIYVLGFSGGSGSGADSSLRIEKRNGATGELISPSFAGDGSFDLNPSGVMEVIPRRILADSTYLYALCSVETSSGIYNWRVYKLSQATGELDLSPGGFGSPGGVSPGVGFVTSTVTNGIAGDMAFDGTYLYVVGQDFISPATNTRIERRFASTGALAPGAGTTGDPSWGDGGTGIIVQAIYEDIGYPSTLPETYDSGARCITLELSGIPGDTRPFMLVGGWIKDGSTYDFLTGITTLKVKLNSMIQKRFLSNGALDVYDGVGGGFGLYLQGTYRNDNSAPSSEDDSVQSITSDGTNFYAFLVYRSAYPDGHYSGLLTGYDYWAMIKNDVDDADTPYASAYLLGAYGPVPRTSSVNDYGCCMVAREGKRVYFAGSNIAPLGDLAWRIEKRKTSTLALDSLFNTEGVLPGTIDVDPSPGTPAGPPESWFDRYYGVTYYEKPADYDSTLYSTVYGHYTAYEGYWYDTVSGSYFWGVDPDPSGNWDQNDRYVYSEPSGASTWTDLADGTTYSSDPDPSGIYNPSTKYNYDPATNTWSDKGPPFASYGSTDPDPTGKWDTSTRYTYSEPSGVPTWTYIGYPGATYLTDPDPTDIHIPSTRYEHGATELGETYGYRGYPEYWYKYSDGTYYYTLPSDYSAGLVSSRYTYTPFVPAVIGKPDRAWAVITTGGTAGRLFIVGMDSTDAAGAGQWRIECRKK